MFARLRSSPSLVAGATAIALAICAPSTKASWFRGDVVPATSEHDPALTASLVKLSPSVSPDEARRVAFTAYTTGRQLAEEWRMVKPATVQSFLIHIGARKAGHCFQYANELLLRLDALKLRTLELHWAECNPREFDEHNVIVVTARGQPFDQGIVLDNWRQSGRLVWGPVKGDPPFRWQENQWELSDRLQHPRHYSQIIPRPEPERSSKSKQKEKAD
ncbi:MAG TPA: hypothetical protein VGW57_06905 [Chthoniobacterales bacterium]|nr:hypothetical protein [Chthoniobacterales bacterium]